MPKNLGGIDEQFFLLIRLDPTTTKEIREAFDLVRHQKLVRGRCLFFTAGSILEGWHENILALAVSAFKV